MLWDFLIFEIKNWFEADFKNTDNHYKKSNTCIEKTNEHVLDFTLVFSCW